MESRVELFARIRRDARVKGLSIRCLAREYRVSRRTVRQALAAAEPPERRTPVFLHHGDRAATGYIVDQTPDPLLPGPPA